MIDISELQEIYTVSRLNREVRYLLEGSLPPLWIEGEISNFSAPHSGHWYFSLKDENAQVRCAMFRPQNRSVLFKPKEGLQVLAKARVSLYEGRGDFQLIIDLLEEAGFGKLQRAFEALKKKLAELGLFDAKHKKALPRYPRCIGIITSTTGAAVHDILQVLKRRFCCVPIIIYPTLVQGDLAAAQIVNAIQCANRHRAADVLILARGGGAIEDLWPFNEEIVAEAIFNSQLPIVTGIGHEIDFTIADFVADLRAPTPTAAAELTVPDQKELSLTLINQKKILGQLFKQKLLSQQNQLAWFAKLLQQLHPKRQLLEKMQQLDLHEAKLIRLQLQSITDLKSQLNHLSLALLTHTPAHRIEQLKQLLHHQQDRLQHAAGSVLQNYQKAFVELTAKLDALSPLATLKRGFAIVMNPSSGMHLHSITEIKRGDRVRVRLQDGEFSSEVL